VHPRTALARTLASVTTLGVLAFAVGCSTSDAWSGPHAAPVAVGALGVGFVAPGATPSPEATIRPAPGSWDRVHPSAGYRVVLLSSGDDAPTRALVTAVREWAEAEHVDLRTLVAEGPHDLVPSISRAVELHPDLVVSAGNDLVDPLALVTASHLDQQFLVVGAEVAEPTHNVTAVDWSGAAFRGEGLGASSQFDPASFTATRCADAIRAGVAAVLHDLTGIVVWLS